jgi:hypothetical protein
LCSSARRGRRRRGIWRWRGEGRKWGGRGAKVKTICLALGHGAAQLDSKETKFNMRGEASKERGVDKEAGSGGGAMYINSWGDIRSSHPLNFYPMLAVQEVVVSIGEEGRHRRKEIVLVPYNNLIKVSFISGWEHLRWRGKWRGGGDRGGAESVQSR